MSNLIATDLQGLQVDSPLVDLFILEIEGGNAYFHPGVDGDLANVQFVVDGTTQTFVAFPMILDGLEVSADGAIARPNFSVANIGTNFSTVLGSDTNPKDLVGKRVTRLQTLQKYLVGEGASGGAGIHLTKVVYNIDRIARETNVSITFEVSAIYDLEGLTLPRRKTLGKFCSWIYQGAILHGKGGCSWAIDGFQPVQQSVQDLPATGDPLGQPFFDIEDKPLISKAWADTSITISTDKSDNSVSRIVYVPNTSSDIDRVARGFYVNSSIANFPTGQYIVGKKFETSNYGHYFYTQYTFGQNTNLPRGPGYDDVEVTLTAVSPWNSAIEYSDYNYVKTTTGGTRYWLSKYIENLNNDPLSTTGTEYWIEARVWEDHQINHSYVKNELVRASTTINGRTLRSIWKCLIDHNSGSGGSAIVPSLGSAYWIREDQCGKTLNSCKCRFQVEPTDSTFDSPPKGGKNTEMSLPFGSFPGMANF